MSRKFKKGYFVRGQFVAEGSELDLELKRELKGDTEISKTDLKRESTELQKLGEELVHLRAGLFNRLDLSEKLVDALAEARRITNFEGKRRQMQFVGKLMRLLDPATLQSIRDALEEQRAPSAADTLALHQAEQWRERFLTQDDAVGVWMQLHPSTDAQQLRALVRQAKKDAKPELPGAAPRHGRAYRELFQLVRDTLKGAQTDPDASDDPYGDDNHDPAATP